MPTLPYDQMLARGFYLSKHIARKHATTFYLASHFLPRDKRYGAYSVYALCRLSDEAVDDIRDPRPRETLAQVQQNIDTAYTDAPLDQPVLLAFRATVRTYHIPKQYFDELIDGMRMDLDKNRYRDFEELRDYAYKAAGVIGLIMLHIFGCRNVEAKEHAVKLGIALQLTNIIRDIKEDLTRNRIYLPQEEMRRFMVGEKDIMEGKVSENFKNLLKFQIQRARDHYREAEKGIKMIEEAGCRLVATAIARLYILTLDAVEKNGYDIFSKKARIGRFKKFFATAKLLLGRNHCC